LPDANQRYHKTADIRGSCTSAGYRRQFKNSATTVESYLMKRKQKQQGDNGLEKEISSAVTILQEMVTRAMAPA